MRYSRSLRDNALGAFQIGKNEFIDQVSMPGKYDKYKQNVTHGSAEIATSVLLAPLSVIDYSCGTYVHVILIQAPALQLWDMSSGPFLESLEKPFVKPLIL